MHMINIGYQKGKYIIVWVVAIYFSKFPLQPASGSTLYHHLSYIYCVLIGRTILETIEQTIGLIYA